MQKYYFGFPIRSSSFCPFISSTWTMSHLLLSFRKTETKVLDYLHAPFLATPSVDLATYIFVF